MKKRGILNWFLIGFVFLTFSVVANLPKTRENSPVIMAKGEVTASIGPSKELALSLLQIPIIDPDNQNATLPPITIPITPEIPPGVNRTLLERENRTLTVIYADFTIDARFIDPETWWLEVSYYGSEDAESWTMFLQYNLSVTERYLLYNMTIVNDFRWTSTFTRIYWDYIPLREVMYICRLDQYPMYLAINLKVYGYVAGTRIVQNELVVSAQYQQAVQVVAP